ncbi:MAG: SpoIIE family protein phosphatase [Bacteroidetes bacterium]|nr:SpoIIE family protein phosphatase [Bacteroidota bacterium]MBU2505766.1 SpoIIE family protein phosphatase [Bacteroidota bacterium]
MRDAQNISALGSLSTLVDFGRLINSNLNLDFALNNLLFTCLGKFHSTKGFIALFKNREYLEISSSKGISEKVVCSFPRVHADSVNENEELKTFLERNNFEIKQEIIYGHDIKGFIFLGKKLNKNEYTVQDKEFLKTLVNIGSSAIQNSLIIDELKDVNRNLDAKVNQLSSLFDLSKEFSGVLETQRIGKLLVFSIIGQLLVSKFGVVICREGGFEILESRIQDEILVDALKSSEIKIVQDFIDEETIKKKYKALYKIGIILIVPMKIKSEIKGLILLGSKNTKMSYTQSDIEFVSSLGSIAITSIENGRLFEEALEKKRLEKDLEIAQNIQRNLLPKKMPLLNNFEIAAYNNSARQVGGDYYDIVRLDKNRTLVAIADVSGKGVQAALLMANLQAFLKSICKQNIELHEASNLINDLVSENTTDGSFITFFWGILNDDTLEFQYVNMGHNPPLLVRKKEITKLKIGGMILGVMPTMIPYSSEKIELQSNDNLILFTDGITEAMNSKMEEYSDEKFESYVKKLGNLSAEKTIHSIIKEVEHFTEGVPQSDDITSLIIRVK